MQAAVSLPAGLGRTALLVAAARAAESARVDRLFDDPYAAAFVAAAGAPPAAALAFMGDYFALRTRFFDDLLAESGCRQVVLLAAGLDTRAYRLAWPRGTRLFEVDVAEVLAFKQEVLSGYGRAACELVTVPADLREDWAAALRQAGWRATEPTAWLAEGILVYLDAGATTRLVKTVTGLSAPGSHLGMSRGAAGWDVPGARAGTDAVRRSASGPGERASRALTAVDDQVGAGLAATWLAPGAGETPAALAARLGWVVHEEGMALLAARHRRPTPPVSRDGGLVRAVLPA